MDWHAIVKKAGYAMVSVFLIATIVGALNYPGYNPGKNYLSDLGIGTQSASFFNAGLIISGIIGIIFAYGTYKTTKNIGAFLLLASHACLVMVGVYTEYEPALHSLFALGFFLFAAIGALLIQRNAFSVGYAIFVLLFGITQLTMLEHAAVLFYGAWVILQAKSGR